MQDIHQFRKRTMSLRTTKQFLTKWDRLHEDNFLKCWLTLHLTNREICFSFLFSTKQSDYLVLLKCPRSMINFLSGTSLCRLLSSSTTYLFSNTTEVSLQHNFFPFPWVFFDWFLQSSKPSFSELNLFQCTYLIILENLVSNGYS